MRHPDNKEIVLYLHRTREIFPPVDEITTRQRKKYGQEMDEIDKRILNELQKDAKLNMKALASELNLSKSPLYERVKQLEDGGYIRRYAAVVDKDKVGKPLVVFCHLSVSAHNHESYARFVEEVLKIDEIVECYSIGGEYDLLLKIVLEDLNAYDKFRFEKLTCIQGIAKINTTVTIREFKNDPYIKI